ncbi:MAG: hypothetical protein K2Y18_00840 [Alphaproteobacteria bacterium]|jgi:hypothetical protein|nr:hypothetical protein [Alphaproteobacteria bacterium]
MNRIFLTVLSSVALFSISQSKVVAAAAAPADSPSPQHLAHHPEDHSKAGSEKSAADMAKELEDRLAKLKDAGASLNAELKAEFDYNLEIADIEIKALKNPIHRDHKRHAHSCGRHLASAEHILKKHEHQVAREKKEQDRKAKMEERKLRAQERKAKAEERKAKREEARKEKHQKHGDHHDKHEASVPHKDNAETSDHGKKEGAEVAATNTEADKPVSEEKK